MQTVQYIRAKRWELSFFCCIIIALHQQCATDAFTNFTRNVLFSFLLLFLIREELNFICELPVSQMKWEIFFESYYEDCYQQQLIFIPLSHLSFTQNHLKFKAVLIRHFYSVLMISPVGGSLIFVISSLCLSECSASIISTCLSSGVTVWNKDKIAANLKSWIKSVTPTE